MLTTKLEWFTCNERMPTEYYDILYITSNDEIRSGYYHDNYFTSPYCGEIDDWKVENIKMWAYFPKERDFTIPVQCEWRPYHYEDSTIDKPYHFQNVIFVSDAIGPTPAVYSGYYDSFKKHFISYQEDFRFNGAEVQYWMPLPAPPEEN